MPLCALDIESLLLRMLGTRQKKGKPRESKVAVGLAEAVNLKEESEGRFTCLA